MYRCMMSSIFCAIQKCQVMHLPSVNLTSREYVFVLPNAKNQSHEISSVYSTCFYAGHKVVVLFILLSEAQWLVLRRHQLRRLKLPNVPVDEDLWQQGLRLLSASVLRPPPSLLSASLPPSWRCWGPGWSPRDSGADPSGSGTGS